MTNPWDHSPQTQTKSRTMSQKEEPTASHTFLNCDPGSTPLASYMFSEKSWQGHLYLEKKISRGCPPDDTQHTGCLRLRISAVENKPICAKLCFSHIWVTTNPFDHITLVTIQWNTLSKMSKYLIILEKNLNVKQRAK